MPAFPILRPDDIRVLTTRMGQLSVAFIEHLGAGRPSYGPYSSEKARGHMLSIRDHIDTILNKGEPYPVNQSASILMDDWYEPIIHRFDPVSPAPSLLLPSSHHEPDP